MPPLLSLLMSGGGGILGSLGDKLSESLGLTPDVASSTGTQSISQGLQMAQQAAPGLTQAAMYNQAGQTGADVGQTFQRKLDQLGQSSQAINTANRMRSLGGQGISNALSQFGSSQTQAAQQAGALRRSLTGAMAGRSPASIAGAMGSLGQGVQQGATQALAQGQQSYGQATGLAGSLTGQAQNVLGQDLALRNQIYVDPYKAQVNQGIMGMPGQFARNISGSVEQARTNPLAGFASGLGMWGSGSLLESMGMTNENTT